ncbi:unnamed protein product [Caenorhabditis auriculariae]|uniref:Uncharacterized protein n=1 Tax=Caenorhabditis auriculariae TaxID=2777116 RepID=A0A8S1HEU7_9PELO|nr:unnamed protein product [Caenorhabditis auriculariae]
MQTKQYGRWRDVQKSCVGIQMALATCPFSSLFSACVLSNSRLNAFDTGQAISTALILMLVRKVWLDSRKIIAVNDFREDYTQPAGGRIQRMTLDVRTPQMPPPPPMRGASNPPTAKVTFKGAQTWKESIGMALAVVLGLVVVISILVLLIYVWRDKQVYEELVDYLDKTISISKINYNPMIGLYQLSEKELGSLGEERMYKNLLRTYLLTDFGVLIFVVLVTLLYFSSDVESGTPHVVFWVVLSIGVLYAVVQVHVFTFALSPYSAMLPNATEKLLNHAIPHNPGGLQQMEQRLGCTFDHNLYAANRRRMNPQNTCDPQIESSFIPRTVLFGLLGVRLLPVVFFFLLLLKRSPLSEGVAQVVEKLRRQEKKRLYVKKQQDDVGPIKSTTFGVTNTPPRITSTPLPPVPSPSQLDHSISYNNAAYFATSGAYNSSRSSEISRIDASELFKNPINRHASGSLQSEV